jgi:hypothetical protein
VSARESEGETEVRDDMWGRGVSERERERERERESQRAGARQAALLGHVAGPSASASAGARERAARLGRTGGKEGIGPVRISFLFFFFK